MATTLPMTYDEPAFTEFEDYVLTDTLELQQVLSGQNLASLLNGHTLTKIGQQVIRDVEIDEASRKDWKERNEKNIKIAMQVKEAKVFPWPGAANSKSPVLTVAAIQFNAEAYPVIVDGSNLVKGRVLGPDPDGEKRARADRIGQHMTWQLLYRMPGWEEETDKLLLCLPIVGCMFRKTWYDSIENANRSEIVTGEDFIIHNDAKSIETAPRYTQVLHYYPYEVREFITSGLWAEVPVDDEDTGDDDQALGDYYEQHRYHDLDGDGYPEPYVVTSTKEGKIARIVPCFGPEDIRVTNLMDGSVVELAKLLEAERIDLAGNIVKITRRQYFTKYGFIPAPDGSFYDVGFGDLLGNITDLIDKAQNQIIDASALANAQGGFVGSGVTIMGGNFSFRLGEWKRVDVVGGVLKDNIMPLALPGPSAVSISLLEMLYAQAKDITSSQDVVAGRAPPNQPATTTLALIEQAGSVKKGILKRIYRSFGQELRILRRLNRDYLDEEEYFQLNDAQEAVKIGREDYADEDLDVIPVADPTQISDTHKMVRAQAMFTMFNGDPLINQRQLRQQQLEALGVTDTKTWFEVPAPQPPPELMIEMGKLDIEREKGIGVTTQAYANAAKTLAEAGLLDDAAALAAKAVRESEEDADTGPGGASGMAGPTADEGVSGLPEGTPAGLDGGMGEGDIAGGPPGGPGAGGPAGPTIEPPIR